MSTLFTAWLALLLLGAPDPAAEAVAPLKDPFDIVDDAYFSLFIRDRKVGETHTIHNKGTITSESTLVRPTGPRTVSVTKTQDVRVYSPKDGLLDKIVCSVENPNQRVDGHREGNDVVLNVKVANAVSQYRTPAPHISNEYVPRRLAVAGVMGSKLDYALLDCFTGKSEVRHAVLQSKAMRRVGGATVQVFKVVVTGIKPTDNATLWLDAAGNDVELRIKGGMAVMQRDSTPRTALPKNPFTSSDASP